MNMNKENSFVIKGNILYSFSKDKIEEKDSSYLVVLDGKVEGVFNTLPEKYNNLPFTDYKDNLIIPGLSDIHIHAPQFGYRGTEMDLELMPWLQGVTFPEESKYSNIDYAEKAYDIFVNEEVKSDATRLVVFSSRHREATEILMDKLNSSGLGAYVGKVNMDRDAPPSLVESTSESVEETIKWLDETKDKYSRIKPILTPRFVPSCTDTLFEELEKIRDKYNLPVQSHLSENHGEIELVHKLRPGEKFYGEVYEKYGLFGSRGKCIMAHCVYSSDDEISLMKKNGVYIAHAPESNENLSSGIAPIRKYLDEGLNVALSSDVAGGCSNSILFALTEAIKCSKLRWRLVDESLKPLTFSEAFYMASVIGGSFFGKIGTFLPGYEGDVIVLDDSHLPTPLKLSSVKRLERFCYLDGIKEGLVSKYVSGEKIFTNL